LRIKEVSRLQRQRGMRRHKIRVRQTVFQTMAESNASVVKQWRVGLDERVMDKNLHSEHAREQRHFPTDAAKSANCQRFAR
jgi:hypothetical protein